MKLTGKLKENIEKAENREEVRKILEEAGVILNDEELDQVVAGTGKQMPYNPTFPGYPGHTGVKPEQHNLA